MIKNLMNLRPIEADIRFLMAMSVKDDLKTGLSVESLSKSPI